VARRGDRRSEFDRLYAGNPDPWDFATSKYERAKREVTIAALGRRRFERALEAGCGPGFLTEKLAAICREVLAFDVSEEALTLARQRLGAHRHVRFSFGELPADWPEGTFQLVVLSEFLYFLDREEIAQLARLARQALSPDGFCLLVNWTGPSDLPIGGDEAAELFRAASPWTVAAEAHKENYRLDLLRPDATPSAAPR
jgi:SAM-dependent methyltransferase